MHIPFLQNCPSALDDHLSIYWLMRDRSIRLIATPQPHQRIRQGLLEDTVVTMTRAEAKDKTVLITLDFEGFRRPPPGHDPVVTGSLGITSPKVVLRYV